jgi:hypothetical protein
MSEMETGQANNSESGLVEISAHLENGRIISEVPRDEIARLVGEGIIVVLKGAIPGNQVLEFRNAVQHWSRSTDPYPHGKSPSTEPDINFHRIDDGKIQSSLPHVFHQFGFGNYASLEEVLGPSATTISAAMLDLQNEIAGSNFDFSTKGCRLKVLHYPAGGGYLEQHAHPLEPQRVGLILSGAQAGADVSTGGTFFLTPFGRVDASGQHDLGDLILFRYDLPHGVSAVDADSTLEWSSAAGKWSIVLELRETHALSQAKQTA